jgi:cell division septal protein FtsQ
MEQRAEMHKVFLALLVVAFVAVVLVASREDKTKVINHIDIKGNALLSADDYLLFAGLQNDKSLPGISAGDVRARLLKHPYIKDAVVYFSAPERLQVDVFEKTLKARMFSPSEYFVTSNLEMIKSLKNTSLTVSDLPVISGLDFNEKEGPSRVVVQKIGESVELINATLSDSTVYEKNLSEISFFEPDKLKVTLSNLHPKIYLTDNNITQQVHYITTLLKEKEMYAQVLAHADYVDVRFEKKIFVGYSSQIGI